MKLFAYLLSPWTDIDRRQSSHGDSVSVLDGVRGLAVLIVLASHTGTFGQGSVGVFLFFALSGFVLTLPFADRPGRIFQAREVWHYVANRALRIFPAFVVVVLLLAWQNGETWRWIWLNLSFYAGWNHLWSVAEEVRFYILFPFVVAALALLPSRAARIAALIGLIALAWFFRYSHLIDMLDGRAVAFYFYFFLTGMLACLIYRALKVDLGYSVDVLAPVLVAAFCYLNGWVYSEIWCLLFLFLLVGVANSNKALTGRLLRSKAMRHIGLLSYSLYLFHFSVSTWLWTLGLRETKLFAATFAVTYTIAIASYLAVEKPFLMLKPKRITRPTSPEVPASAPAP